MPDLNAARDLANAAKARCEVATPEKCPHGRWWAGWCRECYRPELHGPVNTPHPAEDIVRLLRADVPALADLVLELADESERLRADLATAEHDKDVLEAQLDNTEEACTAAEAALTMEREKVRQLESEKLDWVIAAKDREIRPIAEKIERDALAARVAEAAKMADGLYEDLHDIGAPEVGTRALRDFLRAALAAPEEGK